MVIAELMNQPYRLSDSGERGYNNSLVVLPETCQLSVTNLYAIERYRLENREGGGEFPATKRIASVGRLHVHQWSFPS